jgi:hypothetical protein
MMVVISIALIMMILILPIFQISTRTISNVERRLAVYEAARNILDYLEANAAQVFINEKGEHFSIKSCSFQDNDAFTPTQGTPDSKPYRFSRREADAMDFSMRAGPLHWNTAWRLILFAGQQEESTQAHGSDGWFASTRSTYQYLSMVNRNQLKSDVSSVVTTVSAGPPVPLGLYTYLNKRFSRLQGSMAFNEPVRFFEPGSEKNAPFWGYAPQGSVTGWQPIASSSWDFRESSRSALLDLNIAYWDDVARKYIDPPDNTAIYFAPPPKSLRFTITVCDREKRTRLTLCRNVLIPCGTGKGVVLDTRDTDYQLPGPFNRTKNLDVLDPNIMNAP